jgi:hypothetical protein
VFGTSGSGNSLAWVKNYFFFFFTGFEAFLVETFFATLAGFAPSLPSTLPQAYFFNHLCLWHG